MKNQGTGISWTHRPGTKGETLNPTTGCTRASPGCEHCYAEPQAARLERFGQAEYIGLTRTNKRGLPVWTGEVRMHPERLLIPLRQRQPRTYFVNSMSDLFHDQVPNEFIAALFGAAAATPQHTYIILTKRAERLPEWFKWVESYHSIPDALSPPWSPRAVIYDCARLLLGSAMNENKLAKIDRTWPLPNVELGVSCENQEWFDKRVHHLMQVPAAVRLVSLEPLLGRMNLAKRVGQGSDCPECGCEVMVDEDGCCIHCGADATWYGVDWVIVGGESGADRRDCDPAWIDDIVKQCADAGASCFVKQDSAFKPGQQGRLSDATWAVKQFPEAHP